MKTSAMISGVLLISLVCVSQAAWPKSNITRIVVEGERLSAPIVITDPGVLKRFTIYSGPGVGGWKPTLVQNPDAPKFIADWLRGALKISSASERYTVTMYLGTPDNRYEVFYRIDRSTGMGYVGLPREPDRQKFGGNNIFFIYREVEGDWYHSTGDWEKVIRPLIRNSVAASNCFRNLTARFRRR